MHDIKTIRIGDVVSMHCPITNKRELYKVIYVGEYVDLVLHNKYYTRIKSNQIQYINGVWEV